ncbi:hypothetical protein OU798_08255 [Prolixibacteraceae bacterium Z1-6]|uniref:Uncharacterized protein n=1 Tax=Draconibacterium aestuarii TaxID=2998507 RepID=A0A9X3J749_9BACT|nr:hypothetical protein [Prolixibacteraceae bacterium Z1-6]
MNDKELSELLDSWENIEIIARQLSQNPKDFDVLMNIALSHPEQRSWRAAYLADKIHDDYPECLQPYLHAIIKKLETENNASKKRHWLKLISMNKIEETYMSFLFDYCIETFTSGKEAVAVRVHAMQILYNISETEPDFKPEVLEIIKNEMEQHPSAGIRSRGRKLTQKLSEQIQQKHIR